MYSDKEKEIIIDDICKRISEKGEALRNILSDEDMPSTQTFYKWLEEDILKSKQYARACELRSEIIFDEILDIADAFEDDVKEDEDGNKIINNNVINRDRLRIDARKWILSKMNPKKYSDKYQIDTTPLTEQPLFPDV